jgi:cell division septation protein DedD
MSDQGFHEVQLSGKQLVFLFMSAVVVMVVVFLLGVNVGRGVRSAVGDTEVLAQAESPAPKGTDPAPASAEPAKPAQPELSYHDMLLAATPAPDKGAAEKAPPTEAPPPISEAPPPVQSPTVAPPPVTESKRTPTQSPPAATPAPKPNGAEWFLQTGAYSTQAVAEGQVAKIKQLSFPAFVLPPERSGTKLFHVRVGPYRDRAEAERASSRLTRQGFPSSITR